MNEILIAKDGADEETIRLFKRLEKSTQVFCMVDYVFNSLYS